jgi:flagellin-like protein
LRALSPVVATLILVGAAFAQVNVGGPTQVQDPAYSLRVRILTRNTSRGSYGIRMWGRADLFGGAQPEQGFDFESTCNEVLMVTHGDERYSARWKKQDRELEMLVSRVGSGKSNKCSVKADLQQFVYEFENGNTGPVVTKPLTK